MPEVKPRNPVEVMEDFRQRLRVFDALGIMLCNTSEAYNPEDIGMGLIRLAEDYDAALAEVREHAELSRAAAGGAK